MTIQNEALPVNSNNTTIRRGRHDRENPYVMISRKMLHDPNLSIKAKGVLCYLLSLPSNWEAQPRQLAKVLGVGKDSIYSTLQELISQGYASRTEQKNSEGQFSAVLYEFYEEPILTKPCPEKPCPENPDTENQTLLNKYSIYKKRKTISASAEADPIGHLPPAVLKIERLKEVRTSDEEHAKLVEKHGEEVVKLAYQELSEWKDDNPPKAKRLKSDYKALIKWAIPAVVDRLLKEQQRNVWIKEIKQREERLNRIEQQPIGPPKPVNLGFGKLDYTPVNKPIAEKRCQEPDFKKHRIECYGTFVGHPTRSDLEVLYNQHPDEFKKGLENIANKIKNLPL